MRPFPWTSCFLEGMWSTHSCSLEPETSAPSLAAHISSCPGQGTSGEWCDSSCSCLRSVLGVTACPRLGTGNTPSTMHVGVPAPPCSPDPSCFCPLPRAVSRGLVVGPSHPRGLGRSRFSLLALSRFPRVDGTETPVVLYSHLVCPARPLPLQNTHTRQCLEPRALSTPSPWPIPPTPHLAPGGPECSDLICGISWKDEGKTAPGVTLPSPWRHPGALMALEAQSFLCIS